VYYLGLFAWGSEKPWRNGYTLFPIM